MNKSNSSPPCKWRMCSARGTVTETRASGCRCCTKLRPSSTGSVVVVAMLPRRHSLKAQSTSLRDAFNETGLRQSNGTGAKKRGAASRQAAGIHRGLAHCLRLTTCRAAPCVSDTTKKGGPEVFFSTSGRRLVRGSCSGPAV